VKIRHALAGAPPGLIVERLAEELTEAYGATEVDLLLVDYRLSTLVPLRASGDLAPVDPAAWRCFDQQAPVATNGSVYVPVTVRGERVGVLRVAPAERLVERVRELHDVADIAAHELSVARALTDRYVVGARTRRLTLAAEMQWELLPGRCCSADQFTLAGQLEPAYAVRGDTFDWSVDPDRLTLTVMDGMGHGVAAAALSALATSALRNARRAGLDLADQAVLADEAIYAYHRGSQYVSVLLLGIDLATGRVEAVDTGSPLLLLLRGDEVHEVRLGAQDPLGMFDGTRYTAEEFTLRPGDRLLMLSDGVHSATSGPKRYSDQVLGRVVKRTRGLATLDVVRTVIADLRAFVPDHLEDDAAVVCLDWTG
jgi:serine phosphatase RsbU (regulator of sigma subunit)